MLGANPTYLAVEAGISRIEKGHCTMLLVVCRLGWLFIPPPINDPVLYSRSNYLIITVAQYYIEYLYMYIPLSL